MKLNRIWIVPGLVCLLGLSAAGMSGCSSRQDEKDAEEVTNAAEKSVEKDFDELGEETKKSIQEDSKTNENQLTDPKDLLDVEEEMAESK